jgi:hypothetical protein
MLIVITEYCAWENERWKYILDLDKQDGGALNDLMIFIRLANIEFEKVKEMAHKHGIFAASRYTFKFYEQIDLTGKYPRLLNKKEGAGLIIASDPGYHSHSLNIDNILSSKRVKSAMVSMRDKRNNILYKNFDSLFLKSKVKQNAS